jgi:hypothetical protein
MTDARIGVERLVVAGIGLVAAAPIGAQTMAALIEAVAGYRRPAALPLTIAAIALIALAALVMPPRRLAGRLPSNLDGAARRHPLVAVLWLGLALVAVVQTARASIFMADPDAAAASVRPGSRFLIAHSSSSGAFVAAALARQGVTDLWDPKIFPIEPAAWTPRAEPIDTRGFRVDRFNYAPPFLLLHRALLRLSNDYLILRMLWFGIEAAIFGATLVGVALWIGGRAGAGALLLAPLVWVASPTRLSLQFGHVYPAALALSVAAMVAFRDGRAPLGGCLLAFATVVRLSPGVLVLQMLARRRWRDAAYTAGAAVGLFVLGIAVFGAHTSEIFLREQVPRLVSGEATPPLTASVLRIAENLSLSGFALKLSAAHIAAIPGRLTRAAQWLFCAFAVALTWWAASGREPSRARDATQWLALLNLAALATPSAPATYVAIGLLWQATLVIAQSERPIAHVGLAVAALAGLFALPVMQVAAPRDWLLPFAAQIAAMAMVAATLLGRNRVETDDDLSSRSALRVARGAFPAHQAQRGTHNMERGTLLDASDADRCAPQPVGSAGV